MKKVLVALAIVFSVSLFASAKGYETSKPVKHQFELCSISTNFP